MRGGETGRVQHAAQISLTVSITPVGNSFTPSPAWVSTVKASSPSGAITRAMLA